jgi:pimeloyl-ACP methyl ester carboxylesterase
MMTPDENRMLRENHDRDIFLEFTKTYVPLRVRQAGMINDAQQFAQLPETAPPGVECPTCIVHGDADQIVPFQHGLAYREAIPQADFLVLENGSHLAGVARRREVSRYVVAFLAKYANQPATLKP